MENTSAAAWGLPHCSNFRFCELTPRMKKPLHSNWQTDAKSYEEVSRTIIPEGGNVGILLGNASGVIDIDCDTPEAVNAMRILAFNHFASFSRCPESAHYLFLCKTGGKTIQLRHPEGGTIVELRGNGTQTMVPPSTHPSGKQLDFDYWNDGASEIAYESLHQLVHQVAGISLLIQAWLKGQRHQVSLSLAGLCQSIGIRIEDTLELVEVVCNISADEEIGGRLRNVRSTYQRPENTNNGYAGLAGLVGREYADCLKDWLCEAYGEGQQAAQLATVSENTGGLINMKRPDNINEANLAEVYAQYLHDSARYCHEEKQWYLWDGFRWRKDNHRQLLQITTEFMRRYARAALDQDELEVSRRVLGFLTVQKLENIEKLAKSHLPISLTDFDNNPMQLCVTNGVIDLENGRLLPPQPTMWHSKMAGARFDADARCPHFLQFLTDIFSNDQELVAYVQKVAGYLLTGSTQEQCLFMLLGGGANGKSTLVNLLTDLLGDYAANTAASTLMANNSNQFGDDLIRLAGARLITASETEHGQRFAEAKIKSFTGGDKITARPLYGRWIDFVPVGKIVLTTNNRPEIRGSDDGIWRRIKQLPFNRQFKEAEQDRNLISSLRNEMSGILNWAIEGCSIWQAEGLPAPDSVTASNDAYRLEMDTVASFIDEECHVDKFIETPVGGLYENYSIWCKLQDKPSHSKVRFGKRLSEMGFTKVKRQNGRYWQGLSTFTP